MNKRSPLIPIFLIVTVDILGMAIMIPLLPFYAERFGASPQVVGLLITVYAGCQLIAGPILGQMSDRVGRRPLLLVSQIGTCLGFMLLAYSRVLWLIFLARIIDGLTAGNLSLAQAYISDVTEPKDRARAFGLIGVAFGIGFLLGPAISGYLAQFSFQYPIFAAAALSFTSIMGTYFLLPSETPSARGESSDAAASREASDRRKLGILDWGAYAGYFRRPGLSALLWQFAFFCVAFASFTSGFALFAERRFLYHGVPFGPKEVGYVFAYVGFLGIILQGGFIRPLVRRFGEGRLARAGFLAAAVGYVLLAFTYRIPWLLVVAAIASFGTGVLRPTLTSLITQAVSRNEQGVILGLTQSLFSVAQIISPTIAGFLIDRQWLSTWGVWTGLVMAAALLLRPSAETAAPS